MSGERQGCPQRRDDLAAYALGALRSGEASELERHLDECEGCRARLHWLSPAVDLLPATVEQRTPPESLRESLMATVRAEATPAAAPAAPAAREPWWHGIRNLMMRPAVGMAALILLIAGVGAGWLLRGSDTVEPGSTVVAAEPLGGATPVAATLERSGDAATLHVDKLPAIGRNEVYEVWIERAGALEPSTTFVLDDDGSATAAVPGPLTGSEAIYVSREPRGGSSQPTTKPVLQAPL